MDLEDQWKVLEIIKQYGAEHILVLLGCPDAESSQIQAESVSQGDPSMVGPLSGLDAKSVPGWDTVGTECSDQNYVFDDEGSDEPE